MWCNHLNYLELPKDRLDTPSLLSFNYFSLHVLKHCFWMKLENEEKFKGNASDFKTASCFSHQGTMALLRPGATLALHLIWRGKKFWTLHRFLILMLTHRQNSVWVDKSKLSYVIPCLRDVLAAVFIRTSNFFFAPVFFPWILNSLLPNLSSLH